MSANRFTCLKCGGAIDDVNVVDMQCTRCGCKIFRMMPRNITKRLVAK